MKHKITLYSEEVDETQVKVFMFQSSGVINRSSYTHIFENSPYIVNIHSRSRPEICVYSQYSNLFVNGLFYDLNFTIPSQIIPKDILVFLKEAAYAYNNR